MATRAAPPPKTTSKTAGSRAARPTAKPLAAKTACAPAEPAKPAPAAPETRSEKPAQAVAGGAELKKKELIESVIARSGVKKKYAKPVIEAMTDILGEALAEGRDLNLQPLGKIKQIRGKDSKNARVLVTKIRQSKNASPALDPEDRADVDNSKETVADPAQER